MKNKLMKKADIVIRVLEERDNRVFVIDCIKKTMPYWCEASSLSDYDICSEDELGFIARSEELSAAEKNYARKIYPDSWNTSICVGRETERYDNYESCTAVQSQ